METCFKLISNKNYRGFGTSPKHSLSFLSSEEADTADFLFKAQKILKSSWNFIYHASKSLRGLPVCVSKFFDFFPQNGFLSDYMIQGSENCLEKSRTFCKSSKKFFQTFLSGKSNWNLLKKTPHLKNQSFGEAGWKRSNRAMQLLRFHFFVEILQKC